MPVITAVTMGLCILVADDHALFRAGMRRILESFAGVETVIEAADGEEALRLTAEHRPQLALVDIAMPGVDGIETIRRVAAEFPRTRVLVLSMHEHETYLTRALQAGAAGYVVKSAGPGELEDAIRTVVRGEAYLSPGLMRSVVEDYVRRARGGDPVERLSPRQREILKAIAEGLTTRAIAQKLAAPRPRPAGDPGTSRLDGRRGGSYSWCGRPPPELTEEENLLMVRGAASQIPDIVQKYGSEILARWLTAQTAAATRRAELISDEELREQSRRFLTLFARALQQAGLDDASGDGWDAVRELIEDISTSRARQGFTPAETATFIFSLKQPLFEQLRVAMVGDASRLTEEIWRATVLLDRLGLYSVEVYQKGREDIIRRQQQDMMELSTPVVQLWDNILALPLIGTLDSGRTQVVMESLLRRIVETGAEIAIIDITGVPAVDTLVAQHLLKTVAAARLMGADCIISGIRPQIAQTIVHLGVELTSVVTKATLADAFAVALQRTGVAIARQRG